jgi:hypothetical protein
MRFIPIAIIVGAVVVAFAFILPTILSAFTNDKECPTGSAICSTAAMMPGAVSIVSALIVIVSVAALTFVVFYIRSHT